MQAHESKQDVQPVPIDEIHRLLILTSNRRAKFSHDPNNTNWTRSESKYGQRILQAQGWKPGDYLGAQDANRAKYHTAANSSHIKVFLREENLGLGARLGAAGGEWQTTGLDGFQDLLGRLNGKSGAEIEASQKSRADVQRKIYAEQRFGGLRFVSGGLLVGDQIVEKSNPPKNEVQYVPLPEQSQDIEKPVEEEPLKAETIVKHQKKGKKGKKSNREVPQSFNEEGGVGSVEDDDKETKSTLTKKNASRTKDLDTSKAERRAAKAERKEERQRKREARATGANIEKIEKTADQSGEAVEQTTSKNDGSIPAAESSTNVPPERKAALTRHVSKQRNIRHKKLAMMDTKALNEVSSDGATPSLISLIYESLDPNDQRMRKGGCLFPIPLFIT